jgi:hypothetical protein
MKENDESRPFPEVEATFRCDLTTIEGREYALNAVCVPQIISAIQYVDERLRSAHKHEIAFYGCETEEAKRAYIDAAWNVRQMIRESLENFGVRYVLEV